MNRQLYLCVVTVLVILCGCSQNKVETPNGSALSDSPTITGNISNLSEANLEGTSLKVKAEIGSDPGTNVIAEGNVAANGDFSIKLPGIATLEGDLQEIEINPPQDEPVECALTYTPEMYRRLGFRLKLYSNNQYVEQLIHVNGPLVDEQNEVIYTFSDRDVSIQGSCESGDGIYSYEVEMKKGWNTIISGPFPDGERYGLRTAVPDSSYKWVLATCPNYPVHFEC